VFNHSNEGNHEGPTINFKGVDNSVYYFLNPNDKRYYYDYSGCGNTINANNPIVEKFITDCLTFWAREMHVDGFRFDEGSILSRGEDGSPLKHPPLLWGLELSEIFADTKLITEAWDAAGLYQIGSFPGYRWSEWNGKYRDSVRKFLKGDSGVINEVADRIAGSSSIYQHSRHKPTNSINFVNCHDGFNLYDLVSYNNKHNHENGENNQDGIDDNISWNSGTEGDTDDIKIINFRKKRVKNFVSVLMLSIGVPMILSGDEVGKSQNGNNNAYCQDNEISWFDWDLIDKNSDLFLFFKKIIAFRNKNTLLRRETFFDGSFNTRGLKDIDWHGCKLYSPGWDNSESKVLSYSLASFNDNEPDIHVMINMDYQDLKFEMFPEQNGRKWFRFIDTSLNSPEDIADDGDEELINSGDYQVKSYSVVVLISKKNNGGIYD
jgi:glycogen operon protein